jgi:diaminopimelate epimerase
MRLTKHHGLGNDFLVLLDLEGTRPVTGATVRALCDRHRGIGADGLLRVTAGSKLGDGVTDVTMQLFNADGGRAEMSGNGVSCLAQAVVLAGIIPGPTVRVATDAGVRTVRIEPTDAAHEHRATVDMGVAKVGEEEPEWIDGAAQRAARVDIGNPHLVLHVRGPATDDELEALGRRANDLVPGGINVELVVPGPESGQLTMQVYERGVGLTEACGTGACAAAAAAEHWDLVGSSVRVLQPGGPADIVLGATLEMTVPVVHVATIDATDITGTTDPTA